MKRTLILLLALMMLVLTGCTAEIKDPGPPTEWKFNTAAGYFALEEAMKMEDAELEAFAEDRGFWLVPGFRSIRENAEYVCEMMREAKIPKLDGYKMAYITVNPEEGRRNIFVRLEGKKTVHVICSFEKSTRTVLRKLRFGQIQNDDVEKLTLVGEAEYHLGGMIYYFGGFVDDRYVKINVFGATCEEATEIAGNLDFLTINELGG